MNNNCQYLEGMFKEAEANKTLREGMDLEFYAIREKETLRLQRYETNHKNFMYIQKRIDDLGDEQYKDEVKKEKEYIKKESQKAKKKYEKEIKEN